MSRIERGVESPTVERLAHLLGALGETLALEATPPARAPREGAPLSPRERLREAASWNLVASKLEIAGAQARAAAHPATIVPRGRDAGTRGGARRAL